MPKNGFLEWNDDTISLVEYDYTIWSLNRTEIAVIAISEVINGDNDTTIFTIIDNKEKIYHIDMLGIYTDRYLEIINFFKQNFGLDAVLEEDIMDKTVIFYPDNLRLEYPYDKSISTWIIRNLFNAGGGRINKKVKAYINNH